MTSSKSKLGDKSEPVGLLHHHRSHDYAWLITRWKRAAKPAGLKIQSFAESSGYKVYWLQSIRPPAKAHKIYISAGIHGDEPASSEALLGWITNYPEIAQKFDLTIFPCLNPWGLTHNRRSDEQNYDLNRTYQDPDVPHIRAQLNLLAGRRFQLALSLHEDYDAQGAYLYEIPSQKNHIGESLIQAMAEHFPIEPRSKIDGHKARGGVIRRRIRPDTLTSWPEAFALHFFFSERTLTIETPSEFCIDQRVSAHIAAINAALRSIN